MTALNLTLRQRQPELMDQPGLDERAHRAALVGIGRVNNLSRIGQVLWREIDRIISERRLKRVRVLDLACGGGDLAFGLARHALRRGIDFSIDGHDISPIAIAHAKEQATTTKTEKVCFFVSDALNEPFGKETDEPYDIIMCSLFLHHLKEEQVVHLLQKMAATARHAVIIDDLRRTHLGYGLAWMGCRLLTRSPMVHVDGPLSVEGAFTVDEACSLAEQAGLQNTRIAKHWPERFLMTWENPKKN